MIDVNTSKPNTFRILLSDCGAKLDYPRNPVMRVATRGTETLVRDSLYDHFLVRISSFSKITLKREGYVMFLSNLDSFS